MTLRDQHNSIEQKVGFKTQAVTTNTTTAGEIIDTQGFQSLEYVIQAGTLTDGAYAILIEDGEDSGLSDAAAVADAQLFGTEALAGFALTDDDKVSKIGYNGGKRFVRLSVVSTATTVGGTLGATAILGHPHHSTDGLTGQAPQL